VIPLRYTELKTIIGGEIEFISKDKFAAVIQGINGNGTIAVFGMNGDKLTSLHPYDAQKHKLELKERIPMSKDSKPQTLAERLEAGKAKTNRHNAARAASETTGKKRAAEIS
jgi:threonine dehydrogenase-like Zn-dependent dehydrogenase